MHQVDMHQKTLFSRPFSSSYPSQTLAHRIVVKGALREAREKVEAWRERMEVELAPEIVAEYIRLQEPESMKFGEDAPLQLHEEDKQGIEQLHLLFAEDEHQGSLSDLPADLLCLVSRFLPRVDQAKFWLCSRELKEKSERMMGEKWLDDLKRAHEKEQAELEQKRREEEEERLRLRREEEEERREREQEEKARRAADEYHLRNEILRENGVSIWSVARKYEISQPALWAALQSLHDQMLEDLDELFNDSDDDLDLPF